MCVCKLTSSPTSLSPKKLFLHVLFSGKTTRLAKEAKEDTQLARDPLLIFRWTTEQMLQTTLGSMFLHRKRF
jgi:hypothetical protein